MHPRDHLRSVFTALDALFRRAGRGAITKTQTALGLGASYFREQRRRLAKGRTRGYDLGVLLAALDTLGAEPHAFFASAFGYTTDTLDALRRHPGSLSPPPAPITTLLAHLDGEKTSSEPSEDTVGAEAHSLILRLDDIRLNHPLHAIELAESSIELLCHNLLPRTLGLPLLGAWCSAKRLLLELDDAQAALLAGLDHARACGDHRAQGDLLQRTSYVIGARGEYSFALAITTHATLMHTLGAHPAGIGKSLVDRGVWQSRLGKHKDAITAHTAALSYLPSDEPRNRFAALQNLGLQHHVLGDLDTAAKYAHDARALLPGLGSWAGGKLSWLQGTIAVSQKRYSEAVQHFSSAADAFSSISALECALVSLDHIRALILDARPDDAYTVARNMAKLLAPLKKNPIATAALTALIRCALDGRGLTESFLRTIASDLAKGRAHDTPRARIQ